MYSHKNSFKLVNTIQKCNGKDIFRYTKDTRYSIISIKNNTKHSIFNTNLLYLGIKILYNSVSFDVGSESNGFELQ